MRIGTWNIAGRWSDDHLAFAATRLRVLASIAVRANGRLAGYRDPTEDGDGRGACASSASQPRRVEDVAVRTSGRPGDGERWSVLERDIRSGGADLIPARAGASERSRTARVVDRARPALRGDRDAGAALERSRRRAGSTPGSGLRRLAWLPMRAVDNRDGLHRRPDLAPAGRNRDVVHEHIVSGSSPKCSRPTAPPPASHGSTSRLIPLWTRGSEARGVSVVGAWIVYVQHVRRAARPARCVGWTSSQRSVRSSAHSVSGRSSCSGSRGSISRAEAERAAGARRLRRHRRGDR